MAVKKSGKGKGTADEPWQLETPPLTSDFTIHRDLKDGKEVLVCTVGKTAVVAAIAMTSGTALADADSNSLLTPETTLAAGALSQMNCRLMSVGANAALGVNEKTKLCVLPAGVLGEPVGAFFALFVVW